jgi:hypothetical protein
MRNVLQEKNVKGGTTVRGGASAITMIGTHFGLKKNMIDLSVESIAVPVIKLSKIVG